MGNKYSSLLKYIEEDNLYELEKNIKTIDLNKRFENGKTILIKTINKLSPNGLYLLLRNGADPNAYDNNLRTPIFYLLKNQTIIESFEKFKILLEFNTNLNHKDIKYKTPLMIFCKYNGNFPFFIDEFLKYNIDLNIIDKYGDTSINYLIKYFLKNNKNNLFENLYKLLNNGADLNILNKTDQWTPLIMIIHISLIHNNIDLIKWCYNAGANIKQKDIFNKYPIHHLYKCYYSKKYNITDEFFNNAEKLLNFDKIEKNYYIMRNNILNNDINKLLIENDNLKKLNYKLEIEKSKLEIEIDDLIYKDYENCAICLNKTDEKTICGHYMHNTCLTNINLCPICRKSLI